MDFIPFQCPDRIGIIAAVMVHEVTRAPRERFASLVMEPAVTRCGTILRARFRGRPCGTEVSFFFRVDRTSGQPLLVPCDPPPIQMATAA